MMLRWTLARAVLWAAAGTGFTFALTTLGAATVFFFAGEPRPRFQKAMLGFAAGIMTAASVWSLLLPAMEQAEAEGKFPAWVPAVAGTLTGVAFLAGLDALIPYLRRWRHPEERDGPDSRRQTALLMTAITLHNIPEGMAVGLACALAASEASSGGALSGGTGGLAGAAALAAGIGIQNFPEGAAVSLPLRQEGYSRRKAFLGGTLSGAVEPLAGIAVVGVAAQAGPLMPWPLSFAAGAMLYVVVEELVPRAHGRTGTLSYLAGFLLMMALDVAFG